MGASSSRDSASSTKQALSINSWPEYAYRPPGSFSILPEDICLLFLTSSPSLSTTILLSSTCRYWYLLSRTDNVYRQAAIRRFRLSPQQLNFLLLKAQQETWRDVYIRLDRCVTIWTGFACDRATNDFSPYPMEINIQNVYRKDHNLLLLDAKCRWSSLRDSLTRIEGSITDFNSTTRKSGKKGSSISRRFDIDPFLSCHTPRVCTFQETKILRGDDIAVPNSYFAMMIGPIIIGMYDPGHSAYMGAFVLAMEESLLNPFMYGSVSLDEYVKRQWRLKVGTCYRGLLTHAVEGEKKGYHISLSVKYITKNRLVALFSIMLVSRRLRSSIEDLVSWPCILEFSADIESTESFRDYLDSTRLLDTNQPPFNFDSLGFARHNSQLSNPRFSLLDPRDCRTEKAKVGIQDQTREEESLAKSWVLSNLPLDEEFSVLRMGDVLIGIFNRPRVGVFYINI